MTATPSWALAIVLQSVVITAAALALVACLRSRPAQRHAVGVLGLGLLLASPLLALVLPSTCLRRAEPVVTVTPKPAAVPVPAPVEAVAEFNAMNWSAIPEIAIVPPGDEPDATPAVAPEPVLRTTNWAGRREALLTALRDRLPQIMFACGFAWLFGALWSAVRWRRSYRRLDALRCSLSDWLDDRPIPDAGAICEDLGLRRLPPIKVSPIASTPLVLGILRPVIVLPRDLTDSNNPDRLRDIVLHEAAHVARRDPLVLVAQQIVAAMFWWHPGVWLLNHSVSRAREEVCDNYVLRRSEPADYAQLLLELAEAFGGRGLVLSLLGLLSPRWRLEQRIAELLDPGRNRTTRAGRLPITVAALLLLSLCIVVGGIGAFDRAHVQKGSQSDPQAAPHVDSAQVTSSDAVAAVAAVAEEDRGSRTASAQGTSDSKDVEKGSAEPDVRPDLASDPLGSDFGSHFRGRVTGPDSQPVSGARVYVLRYSRKSFQDWHKREVLIDTGPVRATTDADGQFEFDAPDMLVIEDDGQPARTEGLILAAADGFVPDWKHVWDRSQLLGSERRRDSQLSFDLQLGISDVPIEGQLLDPDGRPLPDADVRVRRVWIPDQRTLDTYIEYVSKAHSAVMNGPEFERSLLTPAVLPGATVSTRTDAEGRFRLTGLGGERLVGLDITAPGMRDTSLTVMTRDAPDVGTRRINGQPQDTTYGAKFRARLTPGRTVTGIVIDRDTREPIAGMWVGLRTGDSPVEGLTTGHYPRATDAHGRFAITGVWPELLESGDRTFREVVAVAPPGVPYGTAAVILDSTGQVAIECPRGIPFRLKLTDEHGRPVEADVSYVDIQPNPNSRGVRSAMVPQVMDGSRPISRAVHRGGGVYEGFTVAGPGAVLIRTPVSAGYRPAHVDPKTFFAPGRTEWTPQEQISAYGSHDTLSTWGAWLNQHDYAAIVLIDPAENSPPLELSATVYRDHPRQVTLIDPEGRPVTGATTDGMTFHPWDHELPLRSATFPVRGLRPDLGRRITFYDEPRKLIGFLSAKADGDTPYVVQMQPWAGITGRLLDGDGKPVKASVDIGREGAGTVVNHDPQVGIGLGAGSGDDGVFHLDRLVPGQRYTASAYRDYQSWGPVFKNLVLEPGEVRQLGDIRLTPPPAKPIVENDYDPPEADQSAAPVKPADMSTLGSVAGQFVLDGEIPTLPPLAHVNGKDVPDESLIVDPDSKGIANICLYLRRDPSEMPRALQQAEAEPLVFDVKDGRFTPHVAIVRTKRPILLKNDDPVTESMRSTHGLGFFTLNEVLKPKERDGVATHIEWVQMYGPPLAIKSDLRPWMSAYWLVSTHPYVAVTDANGTFKIDNLPPGDHKFRVWHERGGYLKSDAFVRDLTVSVKPGESLQLPVFHINAEDLIE